MTTENQADPLESHERSSLTVWGKYFSAQARNTEAGWELALLVRAHAPRDAEGVAVLGVGDVAKLRALLDEIELRGDAVLRPRVADEERKRAKLSVMIGCRACGTSYDPTKGDHAMSCRGHHGR